MGVGIAHVRPEENGRPIEEPLLSLAALGKRLEQPREQCHLPAIGLEELRDALRILPVVGEVVIVVERELRLSPVIDPERRRREGIDEERHEPRRIGLEREPGDREHRLIAFEEDSNHGAGPRC